MIDFKTFRRRPCFNLMLYGVPLLKVGPLSLEMSETHLAIGQSSSRSQVDVSIDGAGTSIQTYIASSKSHLGNMDVQGIKNNSH